MPQLMVPPDIIVDTPDGQPYRLRMSQGFNEAMYFGHGVPPTAELGQRIERLMAIVNGQADAPDVKEAFLARLMAMAYHLDYLVTALTGEGTSMPDHRQFLGGLQSLAAELTFLPHGAGEVPEWVRAQLQAAQFRHFSRFGASPQPAPVGPVTRPHVSSWTSLPHAHAPLVSMEAPPSA